MVIDIEIAVCLDGEIYQRMLLEKLEHMVEEADAGIDCPLPRTVKIKAQGNLRFLRVPFYRRFSHR